MNIFEDSDACGLLFSTYYTQALCTFNKETQKKTICWNEYNTLTTGPLYTVYIKVNY